MSNDFVRNRRRVKFAKPLTRLCIISFICVINFQSCKQTCYTQGLVPACPYTNPVWYPDGTMLGFNHQVVQTIGIANPCFPFHAVSYYPDSAGFWLINKDGTNMHRVTTFELNTPAWSKDGKWIAFSNGGQIFKMAFDGTNFDTTHVFAVTNKGDNHFFPSWSAKGDTLFFDSDDDNPGHPFHVYKIAADGTGETNIGNMGIDSIYSRFPFCTNDNHIIHIRGDSLSTYVFSMDAMGGHVVRITSIISQNNYINVPASYGNLIFWQDAGIWRSNMDGTGIMKLCASSIQGFSISKDGIIAYSDFSGFESSVVDKTHGVIWTMNVDGSNQQAFTFNIYH